LFAQRGIIHIPIILVILAVVGAAIWFFFSKSDLNFGTSIEDKIANLAPKPFKDVSAEGKNYTAIKYLAREGVLEGDGNGNFNPNEKLTRAEWAVLLTKMAGVTPDQNKYRNCYSDVGEGKTEAAICYAKEQGWFENKPYEMSNNFNFIPAVSAKESDESFNPGNPIGGAQVAGSLSRLMEWEPGKILTDEEVVQIRGLPPPDYDKNGVLSHDYPVFLRYPNGVSADPGFIHLTILPLAGWD